MCEARLCVVTLHEALMCNGKKHWRALQQCEVQSRRCAKRRHGALHNATLVLPSRHEPSTLKLREAQLWRGAKRSRDAARCRGAQGLGGLAANVVVWP